MQIADKLLTVFDHFWGWQITELNNRSWATQAVALNISKAFDKVWRAVLLHILTSYGISDQIFGLILSFLSNRWLQVVLDGKTLLKFLIGLFLALKFSHYKLITLLWSDISSVTTTRISFWTWIWSTRHCGLGQEVACWF